MQVGDSSAAVIAASLVWSPVRRGRLHVGVSALVMSRQMSIGTFFAARKLAPQEFFGSASWLGFTLTALAGEIWINVTRTTDPVMNETRLVAIERR